MAHKPLTISLVIPAHNEEGYLADCLRAAQAQQLPFSEIIVVDNASSDTTVQIAESFHVTVVAEPRLGIVHARDAGFAAARGEIIARIDADTILPPDWTQRIEAFYQHGAHSTTAWTSGGIFYDMPWPEMISSVYRLLAFRINSWLTGYPTLWGASMALPRTLWQQVAGRTCRADNIHEDLDLATHLRASGDAIFWDNSVVVQAQLRRVWQERRQLWAYLQWWPRTLKIHNQRSWWLCWLIGVIPLYLATLPFALSEALFRSRERLLKRRTPQVPSAFDV